MDYARSWIQIRKDCENNYENIIRSYEICEFNLNSNCKVKPKMKEVADYQFKHKDWWKLETQLMCIAETSTET